MLVTGLKLISDSFSVQIPEYLPLLVLHYPPGGFFIYTLPFSLLTPHQQEVAVPSMKIRKRLLRSPWIHNQFDIWQTKIENWK